MGEKIIQTSVEINKNLLSLLLSSIATKQKEGK
jgi:hypothetical protein